MRITREELERVAAIARLPLTEADVEELQGDLDAVLDRFAILSETVDQGELREEEAGGSLREDQAEPAPELEVETILEDLPERGGRLLRVPRGL